MSISKKGYLNLSIIALLTLSITSFLGNEGFLSEKKGNNECLNLKKTYEFLDCDLLETIGEEELLDLIKSKEVSNKAPNIQERNIEAKEQEHTSQEEENDVLLKIKSYNDLSLQLMADKSKKTDKEEAINSQDFLIKMSLVEH